ncbi:MAG: energy transducer TonB [Syntrophobacteraceae bacterium]
MEAKQTPSSREIQGNGLLPAGPAPPQTMDPSGRGEGLTGGGEGSGGDAARKGSSLGQGLQSGTQEFELAQVEVGPEILSRLEPSYPHSARLQQNSGKVVVRVLVDAQGRAQKPSILQSTPQGLFDASVLEAISKWRFKPGYHKGRAVATWVVLPFQFKMKPGN